MDPSYQVTEETFSSTVAGIEELRAKHHDDWPEWRRVLISSAQAGKRMEQEVNDLKAAIDQCARRTAVATLANKIANIEADAKRRHGVVSWLFDHFWQIVILALGVMFTAHKW